MLQPNEFDQISASLCLRGYRSEVCEKGYALYDTINPREDIRLPPGTIWFMPKGLITGFGKPDIFLNPVDQHVYVAVLPQNTVSPVPGICYCDATWEKMSTTQFLQEIDSCCGKIAANPSKVKRLLNRLHL